MFKPLLIVLGEPYSIFSEIIFKTLKSKNKKNNLPIVFIGSSSLLSKQMEKLGYKFRINNLKDLKNNSSEKIYQVLGILIEVSVIDLTLLNVFGKLYI